MTDGRSKRHDGPNHEGDARSSPYPISRMAPAFDLVNLATEIERADAMLGTVVEAKLTVIVDQIRALQEQAKAILEKARSDSDLHRAKCLFEKQPGRVYHLYRRDSGDTYFSMMGPTEWSLPQPQTFLGSYRLEADMSWTPVDALDSRDAERALLKQLLPKGVQG